MIGYGIYVLVSVILYYIFLPPINFYSIGFWGFLLCESLMLMIVALIGYDKEKAYKVSKVLLKASGVLSVICLSCVLLFALISSHIFNAQKYANLISSNIVYKEISEYTPTIDNVPLMDRDTAELLANRTMGSLVNEVSQFDLGRSRQINYKGRAIRVAPLDYAGFFKWKNNRYTGIPSYISVDMKTQKTEIHKVEGGMKYSPSAYFGDDLQRHLRFMYLTVMMGDPIFEIDEDGKPYWVVPKLVHRVGLFGGTDVSGIFIVDTVSGSVNEYSLDNIPTYVDNVYPVDVLTKLYNYHGKYQGGFWNSVFGQKNVVQVTEGYNYIPKDDDVYVYTGVTSVVSDESNIGFIFVNMRTKEYEYYEIAGAEEFSAMASAEGVVQHLGYNATFPLLLSIEGQPTYCVALKDAGGLVKMYGLVNMSQYQIVVTGNTINDCLRSYRTALKNNGQKVVDANVEENSGIVEDIRTGIVDGTTVFYIKFVDDDKYYSFILSENENIVLVNVGDNIKFEATNGEEKILPATLAE